MLQNILLAGIADDLWMPLLPTPVSPPSPVDNGPLPKYMAAMKQALTAAQRPTGILGPRGPMATSSCMA